MFRFTPYWIVAECGTETGNPSSMEAVEQAVGRTGRMLQGLYRQFYEAFGLRLGLPEVSEIESDRVPMLEVFRLSGARSFRKYLEMVRRPLPPGASAYYLFIDQFVSFYHPPGRGASQGRPTGAERQILHEATHQLVNLYTRVLVAGDEGWEAKWTDPPIRSQCYWFQEGVAELFAGAGLTERGEWEFLVPNHYRIREWKLTRARKFSEWALGELLSVRTGPDMQKLAAQKGLGQQVRLASLFFAEAWSWVHFLYFFEDGKYRDRFFEYAKKELHGVTGPEVFERVWFGEAPADWAGVEEEWLAYVAKLLEGD